MLLIVVIVKYNLNFFEIQVVINIIIINIVVVRRVAALALALLGQKNNNFFIINKNYN